MQLEIDVPSELLPLSVPKLCLQPLVENAVEHGIAPAGGGEILLRCGRGNGRLLIEVANTGKAAIFNMSGQRLSAPQKGLNIINGRKVVIK